MATKSGLRGPMDAFLNMRRRGAIFGSKVKDEDEDELSMAVVASDEEEDEDEEEEDEGGVGKAEKDTEEGAGAGAGAKARARARARDRNLLDSVASEGARAPSNHIADSEEEDDDYLPIITSDILEPPRPSKPRPPPRNTVPQKLQKPQKARAPSPAIDPTPSRQKSRLAVHIHSSPITPLAHATPPAKPPKPTSATHPVSTARPAKPARPASREPSTMTSEQSRLENRPNEPQKTTWYPPNNGYPKPDVLIKTPRPNPKKNEQNGLLRRTDPNARSRKREARSDGEGQDPDSKRRARRSSVRTQYLQSNPEYTPYKCDWDISIDPQQKERTICPAELQNVDTLRKHVYCVHGNADQLICRFAHCKDHNPPLQFKTEKEFENHMEKKHFIAYLWHMGDGCQNKGIHTSAKKPGELPAYLFDQQGKQVTPSIVGQQVESDPELRKRKRRLKRVLYEQNENAISDEEWMKQMLGIA
ncbi:hypothetical protein GGR50DRAFT_603051 [Xylaria sp. CBS 124048]|nr:hypothetical protein GGR50DRAFT_603051 [Xylaria sp. CBS 124048]